MGMGSKLISKQMKKHQQNHAEEASAEPCKASELVENQNVGATYKVGELVERRDSGDDGWVLGFVTSLEPLEVTYSNDLEDTPYTWDCVRKIPKEDEKEAEEAEGANPEAAPSDDLLGAEADKGEAADKEEAAAVKAGEEATEEAAEEEEKKERSRDRRE